MKYILKNTKKLVIIFVLSFFLLLRSSVAYADNTSTGPTPPAEPTIPTAPQQPAPPTQPTLPTATPSSTSTTTPTPTSSPTQTTTNAPSPATNSTSPNDPSTTNNGALSNNTTTQNANSNSSSAQQNTGTSNAAVTQNSTTGNNASSDNVGSDQLSTDTAHVSGTVVNGVNTNLNNVSVSEFNIAGDQTGDIVLDFPANCILNCSSSTPVTTEGNGAASNNTTNANQSTNSTAHQTNNAGLGNSLSLHADSGNNTTSQNTSGDSAITTGNADVAANSLGFANNNLDGGVAFGVVNIYGNLNGDIILPESALQAACGNCSSGDVSTTGNGAVSNTTTNSNTNATDASNQANGATITNTIKTDASTGDNSTSENTTGDNGVTTGTSTVNANSLTLANNNLDGGTWWLVLINNHGNWSGQLLGGNGDTASNGLNFTLNPQGNIATNNNGTDSQNTTTVTDNVNNASNQSNTATLNNSLDLSANTGNNHADQNTGGNSTINTGNANILANLVNFVNNNLTHGAKLVVTVVNVFGSWVGNFVTPADAKQNAGSTTSAQVSQATTTPSNTNTNGSNSTTADPSNGDSSNASVLPDTTMLSQAQVPATSPYLSIEPTKFSDPTQKNVLAITDSDTPAIQVAKLAYVAGARNGIDINAAWLVVILPFIALSNLLRKKILSLRNK